MSTDRDAPLMPRKSPCASCPFRVGTPSGVWAVEEYEKLPAYDGDTAEQAQAAFLCHQKAEEVCAGWLGFRDPTELLAVRLGLAFGHLDPSCAEYATDVPLFSSGAQACAHGLQGVDEPTPQAQEAIAKIVRVRAASSRPLA